MAKDLVLSAAILVQTPMSYKIMLKKNTWLVKRNLRTAFATGMDVRGLAATHFPREPSWKGT